MKMITQVLKFAYASARDRKNLADWLEKLPAERSSAILASFGARSARQLNAAHVGPVFKAVQAELAKRSPQRGAVSLFGLADTIHATVADIRHRDTEAMKSQKRERDEAEAEARAEAEAEAAPLRAAVAEADNAYESACVAHDAATRDREGAYRMLIEARDQREAARRKITETENRPLRILGDGRFAVFPRLEAQHDSAVAAHKSAESYCTAMDVEYRETQRLEDAAHENRRAAQNTLSEARKALKGTSAED